VKSCVLIWNINTLGWAVEVPAALPVTLVAPFTLKNDPTADDIKADDTAEKSPSVPPTKSALPPGRLGWLWYGGGAPHGTSFHSMVG